MPSPGDDSDGGRDHDTPEDLATAATAKDRSAIDGSATLSPRDPARPTSLLAAMINVLKASLEGLQILLTRKYVFLVYICSSGHLPLK